MMKKQNKGFQPSKNRVSAALLVVCILLFSIFEIGSKRSVALAQSPPTDVVSVGITGTYQFAGPVVPLPAFNFGFSLANGAVTASATVSAGFGSDYTIQGGTTWVVVSYRGSIIGSAYGTFTESGQVQFGSSSFSVPAGATMDDLDFGYSASYTISFVSIRKTASFNFSDYYSSGRTYDGGIISGNERYDLSIQRGCPAAGVFSASPNSVQAGSPVTLRWTVSNRFRYRVRILDRTANTVVGEFANGIGEVVVTPSVTTTYELVFVDGSGNPVSLACLTPATVLVQITSGPAYFWLVKRIPKEGVTYPPGAPPFYIEPDLGTMPPGTNDPESYSRIPETGTFTAPSYDEGLRLEPYLTTRKNKESEMRFNDRTLPGGLVSDDFLRANADYTNAEINLFPKAKADFNRQVPGYSGPKQGPGIPSNIRAPKRNERVDPYEN